MQGNPQHSNALTNQKNLARTSKTPGRTQLINLFELEPGKRLVDLPGYGYAQVSEEMKTQVAGVPLRISAKAGVAEGARFADGHPPSAQRHRPAVAGMGGGQ